MSRPRWRGRVAGIVALLAAAQAALAQQPYVGFVYPAGGRQGATVRVTLGGQGLEGVNRVFVSGAGVRGRLVEYNKKMNNQEIQLLNEQVRELKNPPSGKPDPARTNLIARIEKLVRENVNQPACASIANLVIADISIAADAEPGRREVRVGTPRGPSNPLPFCVGQLPEVAAPPLPTSPQIILGKEAQSIRKPMRRAAAGQGASEMMMAAMSGGPAAQGELDDEEVRLGIPCVANGQIAQGSVDRYRFEARKGQRLVLAVQARELVPYMADAVPGWFQPVLVLRDAAGRELAYCDDYRFKPDPVIMFDVPADGEYRFEIRDAIYRGREDFVYRVAVGELPFVTGIFPLGARQGEPADVAVDGWNLAEARLALPADDPAPCVRRIAARGKDGILAESVPFARDTLPECLEKEPNNERRNAQRVSLPVIVNGRVGKPGDQDIFCFNGRAGDTVVAEVTARRLDSPLDSVLRLTDSTGRCLALNDDCEDAGSGMNTHHADSYLRAALPTNGPFFVQLTDAQHGGGGEYAYRLRISAPLPDFALRVVPSSATIRSNAPAWPAVHVIRRDGFAGPIRLTLKDPPPGIQMNAATLSGTQTMTRVGLRTKLPEQEEPLSLTIEGVASNGTQRIARAAVPAEDRMQAFLWRHLVPAREFRVVVLNPTPPRPKAEPPKK